MVPADFQGFTEFYHFMGSEYLPTLREVAILMLLACSDLQEK